MSGPQYGAQPGGYYNNDNNNNYPPPPPANSYQMNPMPPNDGNYGQQPQYGQQPYGNGYGNESGYAPPQGPPPNGYKPPLVDGYNGGPPPPDGPPPSYDEVFKVQKPKYNDWWAGILFLATVAGFVAVSAISLHGYADNRSLNDGSLNGQRNTFGLTTHTIYLFVWVLICAIVLSYAYMWMARKFTKQFIYATGILNIVMGLVTAIYMLSRKYWSGGIVFLIFVVLQALFFWSCRSRIPFSTLMLQTAIDVAKVHGHVYLVSAVGGLIGTLFAAYWAITLVAVYIKFEPDPNNAACRNAGGCSSGKVIGLIVFITFAGYWISEWLKNTIHTTVAGIYGSWYFNSRNYPTKVTRGALKRSLTYSFGSISLGSLFIAIINLIRQLAQAAQQNAAQQGDMLGTVLWCIFGCLIGILDWLVEFINRYAFCHIALYGKAYFAAAKDTWKMIKERGIDALINECLIGPVLTFGATFVAYACGLIAYLYMVYTKPAYNDGGGFTPVVVAFAFLIGLQVCNVFTTPLTSGIDTIFVATAWDPEVLMRDHADLYYRMVQVYPHVQEAIHA